MLVKDSINAEGKYESEGVGSASLGGAYTSTHQTTMEGGGTAVDESEIFVFTLESRE